MEIERTDHNEAPSAKGPPRPDSLGLARLAQRISSYTSKGIVSAVVLVAGLGFGRQVLHWWGDGVSPPVPAASEPASPEPAPGTRAGHVVRIGDQTWSLRITSIAGGPGDAAAGLRAACRAVAAEAPLPKQPADEAEQALLVRLAATEPCENRPGGWELFEIRQAVPMTVATLPAVPKTAERASLAAPRRRVVTWGLAIPTSDDQWSIYTFQPDRAGETGSTRSSDVPLPPGARRILAVETPGNGALVAFEGNATPGAWKPFFEDWLARRGYEPLAAWQHVSDSWHFRCRGTGQHRGSSVDVHLSRADSGGTTGLVMVTGGVPTTLEGRCP